MGKSHRTFEEIGLEAAGDRACQQRLARAWRAVQQHALWRLDSHPQEELGVLQRQLDNLAQFPNLLVQPADAGKIDLARIL